MNNIFSKFQCVFEKSLKAQKCLIEIIEIAKELLRKSRYFIALLTIISIIS